MLSISPTIKINELVLRGDSNDTGDNKYYHCGTRWGVEQIVDFKPFLTHARHPDIRAWLDPVRFAKFRLEYGELVWGDYDLCFPVIDLYRNQIEHHASLQGLTFTAVGVNL